MAPSAKGAHRFFGLQWTVEFVSQMKEDGRQTPPVKIGSPNMHQFRVGQTVRIRSGPKGSPCPDQNYRIVAKLPAQNGFPQYRVRNSGEAYERVVTEDQLASLKEADNRQNRTLREKTFGEDG